MVENEVNTRETTSLNGMERLPTEILFSIVKCLDKWETRNLSRVSQRMRGVCLPFLFRRVSIKCTSWGFDLLESLLDSDLLQYVVSFEYVVPRLLKPEIRDYVVFKRSILTPTNYVETCEGYDDVDGYEDWDEMEYFSGDHPSYTRVYKTLRRSCAEQQEIIETGRDSSLIKLAFRRLHNLKEFELVFCYQGDEDWESDYQEIYDMTEPKSYEHHVQRVLAGLISTKGHSVPLQQIELANLTMPYGNWPGSSHWDSLAELLVELAKYAPGLRLIKSNLALALLSRENLNIHDLELFSINTELVYIERFLQRNTESLRSLVIDNISVTQRDQMLYTPLTRATICGMGGLTIERQKSLNDDEISCLPSSLERWKFFFNPAGHVSVWQKGTGT